ncbi:hypothetical protein BJ875DRAFT_453923 [Amylocarpus encephaloides]|uniref:Rhodopsin domain-containing protein n=1 Tax=Amylocarpus encephaloides TaxID=45428 RepID=A0A9P7YPT2_9HELO|nr:hypothetical protein BJ875DRAFT_453923 [Amylocarpus encephaloides]
MSIPTTGIPDELLAMFAIAPEPPGVKSNFINPPDRRAPFVVVGAVFLPIMMIFLTIRLYSKFRISRKPSWDDLTCCIAAFGTVIYYIIMVLGFTKGKMARHGWDISVLMAIQPWFAWTLYVINWFATLILPFTKITFFIFYLQIFRPLRWVRVCCFIGIGFTTVSFTGLWIAQMVCTTPHRGQSWLEMYQDPRYLVALNYLSIPIAATSFAVDCFTFVIPLAAVSQLKLSPRRKFGVVLVFLTGLAAVISSFLGLYYKIVLNSHKKDSTWYSIPVSTTLLTEMSVGVICSCMPSLAKFVGHHFPNFSVLDTLMSLKVVTFVTSKTRSASSSGPSNGSNLNKHGFKKVEQPSSSNEKLHKQPIVSERNDVELGMATMTDTYVETTGNGIEMNRLKGIHMSREWVVEGNRRN